MRERRVGAALAIALLSCGTLAASEQAAQEGPDRFVIVGSVTMPKEPLADATRGIPITFDARFVIHVRIDRILSGASPWKQGTEQVFVIHSPARMFGRHDLRNEPFRFTFEVDPRPPRDRDCRYCVTDLKPEKTHP